jgi:hypothetical protein
MIGCQQYVNAQSLTASAFLIDGLAYANCRRDSTMMREKCGQKEGRPYNPPSNLTAKMRLEPYLNSGGRMQGSLHQRLVILEVYSHCSPTPLRYLFQFQFLRQGMAPLRLYLQPRRTASHLDLLEMCCLWVMHRATHLYLLDRAYPLCQSKPQRRSRQRRTMTMLILKYPGQSVYEMTIGTLSIIKSSRPARSSHLRTLYQIEAVALRSSHLGCVRKRYKKQALGTPKPRTIVTTAEGRSSGRASSFRDYFHSPKSNASSNVR